MLRYLKFKEAEQGQIPKEVIEKEKLIKEMIWLPPTYRNIEDQDLLANFYESSILHRYSFIFYSCVLISSGNEIAPLSNLEVICKLRQAWLASVYVILGLILTGVILGNISDYIENINEDETKFERSLDELHVRLKQNKVPLEFQEKIMVFMEFCHQEGVEYNQPNTDFEYLCRDLRQEFVIQKYENLQHKVQLFSLISQDYIFEMASRFR